MGRKRKSQAHLPRRMYLKCGTYYLYAKSGKWINLGKNYAEAVAEWGRLTDETRQAKPYTINDLLDRYLSEVAPEKAQSTYEGNLKQAKQLKLGLGEIPAMELNADLIYQYMDARPRVAANREIALLSHAYKKGSRWGLGGFNPCRGLEKNKEKPRKRYVTHDEYLAFREFAGQPYSALMDLLYMTALRKSDLLGIRMDQVKADGIHVHISKTDKDRIITWTPSLREAVANARKLPKGGMVSMYLFATQKGAQYTSTGINSMWTRKMDRAIQEGVLSEKFTMQDLRAKAGSDVKKKEDAQALLVHASATTTNIYRRKAEHISPIG